MTWADRLDRMKRRNLERRLARHAWCAYCAVQPRARGSRFCCPEHAEADAAEDWSIR